MKLESQISILKKKIYISIHEIDFFDFPINVFLMFLLL